MVCNNAQALDFYRIFDSLATYSTLNYVFMYHPVYMVFVFLDHYYSVSKI